MIMFSPCSLENGMINILLLLLLLSNKAVLTKCEKDSAYYPPGKYNPNVRKRHYWADAVNVLQDIDQFKKLYVVYHNCATSAFGIPANDEENLAYESYWYLGYTQTYRANAAFSLYGVLQGERDRGCGKATFINSFFTRFGAQTFVEAMQMKGHIGGYQGDDYSYFGNNGFSSICVREFGDDDGYAQNGGNGAVPSMGEIIFPNATSSTLGCSPYQQFELQSFQGISCDQAKITGVIDYLETENQLLNSLGCVTLYDASTDMNDDDDFSLYMDDFWSFENNNGGYNVDESEDGIVPDVSHPLDLLKYSQACSTFFSPQACPDPHGMMKAYLRDLNSATSVRMTDDYATMIKQNLAMVLLVMCGIVMLLFSYAVNRDEGQMNLMREAPPGPPGFINDEGCPPFIVPVVRGLMIVESWICGCFEAVGTLVVSPSEEDESGDDTTSRGMTSKDMADLDATLATVEEGLEESSGASGRASSVSSTNFRKSRSVDAATMLREVQQAWPFAIYQRWRQSQSKDSNTLRNDLREVLHSEGGNEIAETRTIHVRSEEVEEDVFDDSREEFNDIKDNKEEFNVENDKERLNVEVETADGTNDRNKEVEQDSKNTETKGAGIIKPFANETPSSLAAISKTPKKGTWWFNKRFPKLLLLNDDREQIQYPHEMQHTKSESEWSDIRMAMSVPLPNIPTWDGIFERKKTLMSQKGTSETPENESDSNGEGDFASFVMNGVAQVSASISEMVDNGNNRSDATDGEENNSQPINIDNQTTVVLSKTQSSGYVQDQDEPEDLEPKDEPPQSATEENHSYENNVDPDTSTPVANESTFVTSKRENLSEPDGILRTDGAEHTTVTTLPRERQLAKAPRRPSLFKRMFRKGNN